MLKVGIKLYGVEEVKKFVNTISQYEFDFDLTSGRYIIDAKSMIGIFSLDLSKPLIVEIHSDDCDDLIEQLKKFA